MVCGDARPRLDGVADYVTRLAAHLPAYGVDALIGGAGAVGAPGGHQGHRLASRWNLTGAANAARTIRRLRPDVVHVQFAPSAFRFDGSVGLLPLLLGRAAPLVTTLHEYGWWVSLPRVPAAVWSRLERRGWWDREAGLLVPRSRRLLVTTPAPLDLLRRRFAGRLDPVQIPIGPNVEPVGFDRGQARAAVRRELGVPPDTTLLVFFGFVHPVKGVRYLVDALARLRRVRPDLHLLVAGGFESLALPAAEAQAFERELRGHVDAAGVTRHVTITGFRPAGEVSRVLCASDVAVLPFTAGVTTKSGALLAVLAHGLPTVVTRPAAPDPELVDGDTCLVVDRVRDAAAIAGGLRRVLADAVLRDRLAAGGRRLATRHDWAAIAAGHARVYREVLHAPEA
jgi:glycosyltransferase involved in cell wall biosynthesis